MLHTSYQLLNGQIRPSPGASNLIACLTMAKESNWLITVFMLLHTTEPLDRIQVSGLTEIAIMLFSPFTVYTGTQ